MLHLPQSLGTIWDTAPDLQVTMPFYTWVVRCDMENILLGLKRTQDRKILMARNQKAFESLMEKIFFLFLAN